jgi:hypothetical protein
MARPLGRPRFSFAHHAYWMVPLAAPTIALTVWLLLIEEKGATLAQVLSLPFAIYGTVGALFARSEQAAHRPPISGRRKVTIAALTLLIGGVVPAGGWFWYDQYTDVDVRVGTAFQLSEQAPAVVVPRLARSEWGGALTFTPRVVAASTLGDCVLPARLMITPVTDGQRLAVKQAWHNTETAIAIPDGVGNVELDISLVEPPNQACVLTVTLARPVLHRSPF